MRQEFPDHLRLLAISREVLHYLAPLAICHEVSGLSFRCFIIQEYSQPSMAMCSVKLSPNFSPVTIAATKNTAWRRSRLSRIRVRCHTDSTVLLLRWCPVPGAAAAAIANLFSIFFQPSWSFAVIIVSSYLSTVLISSSVRFWSEEIIDFIFPSFLFGLPTALYVLYFMLSSGFHPATLLTHLSSGKRC